MSRARRAATVRGTALYSKKRSKQARIGACTSGRGSISHRPPRARYPAGGFETAAPPAKTRPVPTVSKSKRLYARLFAVGMVALSIAANSTGLGQYLFWGLIALSAGAFVVHRLRKAQS